MAPDARRILRSNLSAARRTVTKGIVGLWVLKALTLSALILFLSTVVVLVAGTGSAVTVVLGIVAVFGPPIFLVCSITLSLLRIPPLPAIAVAADRLVPGEKNLLVASLQLGDRTGELSSYYSRVIIDAVVQEGAELSDTLEFGRLLPVRELKLWARMAALAITVLSILLIFVPGAARPSFSSLLRSPFEKRIVAPLPSDNAGPGPAEAIPRVSDFRIAYQFPEYTGLERRIVETVVGDIDALKGTRVTLEVSFTREVSSAGLVFEDGSTLGLRERSGRPESHQIFSASFTLVRPGTYRVSAGDARGRQSISAPYEIRCQEDADPFIKLVSPPPDVDLGESMELPLEIVCADDYGLSLLRLHYYTNPDDVHTEELRDFKEKTRESVLTHFWNLGHLQMLPSEIVSYFLEVFDNDRVSGPKSARTPLMTARFPTVAELYTAMEEEHQDRIVGLEDILDEARALNEEIGEIAREIKQDQAISWERKKEIEALGKTEQNVMENMERVSRALQEDIQKLEDYDPANWELADRIGELSKLLEEIQSPDLKSAIERLNKALSRLDPTEVERAMTQYALSQEDLLKGLDRAIELLKQIREDEQVRALTEEAARLAEKESQISDELGKEKSDLPRATREQEDVGKSLEALKAGLDELSEGASNPQLSQALREISKTISRGGLLDMIGQSAAMLRLEKTPALRKLVRDVEDGLRQVADQLASAEQSYSSGRTTEVTEKVRGRMHELLRLSREQESLSMCTGKESGQETAMRQQSILDGASAVADRLFEISKETPFLTHKTVVDMGESLREMEKALRSFEANKVKEGLPASRRAYETLNQVLASLLVSQESMCSGQGGMGMGAGFQRMRSLSGLQQGITKSTEELLGSLNDAGRLSESQQETLARLAARQEMVRRGMEEVSRAMGQRRDILGRLDDIIDEMKQVEGRMEAGQLNRDVTRSQNQILSRLLNAQKSVQRRDYSRTRYSKPGEEIPSRPSPPELPKALLTEREKLELRMLRGKADPYPPSYRELIEQYLKALNQGTR